MSKPNVMFELTVDENPQGEDDVMVMSGEGIILTIRPSKTFSTVIPGMTATVTIDFNSVLGHPRAHVLNK